MNIVVPLKKLYEDATVPTYGSTGAAGADLYAYAPQQTIRIRPHSTEKIHTGVAMSIPHGYFGGIYARSGLSTREGLRPANCVGVVDEDYTGEIIVALHNDTENIKEIPHGERIAQIVIQPYVAAAFEIAEELENTERGAGGFGSTGTN